MFSPKTQHCPSCFSVIWSLLPFLGICLIFFLSMQLVSFVTQREFSCQFVGCFGFQNEQFQILIFCQYFQSAENISLEWVLKLTQKYPREIKSSSSYPMQKLLLFLVLWTHNLFLLVFFAGGVDDQIQKHPLTIFYCVYDDQGTRR